VHNKHKKGHQPQVGDGITQEDLQLVPIGQDIDRKRFWIADGPCASFLTLPSVLQRYLRVFADYGFIFRAFRAFGCAVLHLEMLLVFGD